jgi:hypothetical protein
MRIGKLTKAILAVVAIAAMVMGCTRTQEAFEPEYIGGYPTEETAERMFEEYDYQAATQFYVWAYTMLNTIGMDKGYAKMGGDERSIYTFDKRIQPHHDGQHRGDLQLDSVNRFVQGTGGAGSSAENSRRHLRHQLPRSG